MSSTSTTLNNDTLSSQEDLSEITSLLDDLSSKPPTPEAPPVDPVTRDRGWVLDAITAYVKACHTTCHREIREFVTSHYGWSDETFDWLQVGWSNSDAWNDTLKILPEGITPLKLGSVGLFYAPHAPVLQDRIVFAWPTRSGKFAYVAGRAYRDVTPGPKNAEGIEQPPPKYFKQLVCREGDDRISPAVHQPVLGGDLAKPRPSKTLLIPEGYPDWVSTIQWVREHDLADEYDVISPVTTAFSSKDAELLAPLSKGYGKVLLIPDQESEGWGMLGASKTLHILLAGGIDARIVVLPFDGDKSGKWKVDANEYLKANRGLEPFQGLLSDAEEGIDTLLSEVSETQKGRSEAAQNLLALAVLQDPITKQVWETKVKTKFCLKADTLKALQKKALKKAEDQAGVAIKEGLYVLRELTSGGVIEHPLTNFTAKIATVYRKVGDGETKEEYEIAITLASGRRLPPARVRADEFDALKWLTPLSSSYARIVSPGSSTRDHVRSAIQSTRGEAELRTIYTQTGWHMIEGQRSFLMPDGMMIDQRMDSEGQVEVTPELKAYALPPLSTSKGGGSAQNLRAVLDLLGAAEDRVVFPILSQCLAGPMQPLVRPGTTVWVRGRSGSAKSGLVAECLSLFGEFSFDKLPATFTATSNSLLRLVYDTRHLPTCIDNYIPLIQAHGPKAQDLIQAVGDGRGKGRLDRTSRPMPGNPVLAAVIATGEDLPPQNESAIGRTLTVTVSRGQIDIQKLIELGSTRDQRRHGAREFIAYLAGNWSRIESEWASRADSLRREVQGVHARHPQAYAYLQFVFETFLDCCARCKAITEEERQEWIRRSKAALAANLGEQIKDEADPLIQFLEAIESMNAGGQIALIEGRTGGSLVDCSVAGRQAIGWTDIEDEDRLWYLEPNLTWQAVGKFLGGKFAWTRDQVIRRLRDDDLLVEGEDAQHPLKRVRAGSKGQTRTMRLLVIRRPESSNQVEVPEVEEPDMDGVLDATDDTLRIMTF